jgi:hypothetical protein
MSLLLPSHQVPLSYCISPCHPLSILYFALSQETEKEKVANGIGFTEPFNIQNPNQFKESQRQSWDSVSGGWQNGGRRLRMVLKILVVG